MAKDSTNVSTRYKIFSVFADIFRELKEYKHKLKNLSPNAVTPNKDPFCTNFRDWGGIDYTDINGDGHYETVLVRKNSDNKSIRIPIETDSESNLHFPTLSETAVPPTLTSPLIRPSGKELHLPVDYKDLNNDGKLESVARIKFNNTQSYEMEIKTINGKYILSNLE